ncbi:hypothetical protein M758_7G032100 [Ceratodon purpureus]|nr:hypothetical protein M758_7G032100 [Ceratodon purpureus]
MIMSPVHTEARSLVISISVPSCHVFRLISSKLCCTISVQLCSKLCVCCGSTDVVGCAYKDFVKCHSLYLTYRHGLTSPCLAIEVVRLVCTRAMQLRCTLE